VASCTKVVVVSSVRLAREALPRLLADRSWLEVAGTAPSVLEALPLIDGSDVDVVVLTTPADGGFFAAELMRLKCPELRLIVLGVSDDHAAEWIEAGAAAALPDEASLGALEHAVASDDEFALHSTRTTAVLLDRFRTHTHTELERVRLKLTKREWDVARLLGDGLTNKQIAAQLSVELATVKSHVHSVLKKLGVSRRVEVGLRLRGQAIHSPREGRPADADQV
jgi:two-component system, NarL family, nitrate/nitrite response regulator NarL